MAAPALKIFPQSFNRPASEPTPDDVEFMASWFERAAVADDAQAAVYELSCGLDSVGRHLRDLGSRGTINEATRDAILAASVQGQVAAALWLKGKSKSDVCAGLHAVDTLAVHFARDSALRRLAPDRVADLIALVRIGQSAAFSRSLRYEMAGRAAERRRSTRSMIGGVRA